MRLAVIGVGLLMVAGCVPVDTYHATGVSIATRDQDLAQCELTALQNFPVQTVNRRTPRHFIPARQVCNRHGNCYIRGPRWSGGTVYTVDVNESARARGVVGCMAGRGYSRVNLPRCQTEGPVAVSTIMPQLTTESCAISQRDSALVVTPG